MEERRVLFIEVSLVLPAGMTVEVAQDKVDTALSVTSVGENPVTAFARPIKLITEWK